jgi:6-phosphogluconolactonase (cycloisomerase 2 family)
VGTNGEYIYKCTFNEATGDIMAAAATKACYHPSFLCINNSRTRLYAVSEGHEFKGQPNTGGIIAFEIQNAGELNMLTSTTSLWTKKRSGYL